jgi:NADP-dependent 3-hydroxy acid dehydrogenase YdfG
MPRMTRDYENKVVVITGASAGIGAAAAVEIARRGGSLVVAARRKDALDAVAARADALAVVADVTQRAEVQWIFDSAMARFGRVDIWINNAGRGISRELAALSDDDVDAMVSDNVKSTLYGMQVVLPHLQARGDGAIVNVSSQLSRVPFAAIRSAYSAAKAAVNSLSETLRLELTRTHPNIRIVTFMPGPVATDFGASALGGGIDSRALPNVQSPEEVARLLADAALGRRGDVYTMPNGLELALGHLRGLAAG